MTGMTSCYGRRGQQASGNQQVAELLARSANGQHDAMTAFYDTLNGIMDDGHLIWSIPAASLTLLNQLWLTLVNWERATVFLDAIVTENLSDAAVLRQADILCDQASGMSLKAVELRSVMSEGKKPSLRQPVRLSLPPLSQANCTAVWALANNVITRPLLDLTEIKRLGVPPAMLEALRTLETSMTSKLPSFDHLQNEWNSAVSIDNRMRAVTHVLPLAEHFHAAGQQVWTPYMLGRVYTDVLRVTTLFDRLQLGFDPWILTDPAVAEQKATDLDSCKALASFWETIGDPLAAKTLQDEVTQLRHQGSISVQPGRTFSVAPWHPHYQVQAAVTIDGIPLEAGSIFSLYPRGIAGERTIQIRPAG